MTQRRVITLCVQAAAFLVGVAFLALLPHWLSDFRASEVAYVGIYFVAILGLNILTGYTGQISLGHGAFMAIGGYTTAVMVGHHNVRDVWTIPLAGLVAGGAGLLFGLPALRLSGMYLALATFALAVALPAVLKKFDHFTGGTEGIQLFSRPGFTGKGYQNVHVLGQTLTFNNWLYYLCWTVAAILFVVAWVILGGRMGRTFRAIRDSEVAASSSGREPSALQDARFRSFRLLRGHRRIALRARHHLRQPGHVPDRPLPLPRDRGRDLRPGFDLGDRRGCAVHRVRP